MPDGSRWRTAVFSAIALLAAPLAAHGQQASAAPSPEQLLRQMSDELKNARSLRFHAEINFDDVLVSFQKVQYAGAVDVTVRRPDGVYVDYRDDLSAKRFWYDGKTGTLLDLDREKYSTVDLPGDIDAAVARLKEKYRLSLPLGNLISSDVFAIIDAKAIAWGYIGVNDVEGVAAHHIAITGDDADLQVWIQKDGRPLPLKLVITYKDVPSAPQYQAVLMDWKLDARVSDGLFEPALPEGAKQIEFLVAEGGQ